MKPKDVLSIFKICLTAATALAPFIWFHFYPSAPGPDHDSTGKIVAAIGALIVYLVCALYMASIARRIGKADGLAIGYFYNFIYEIEVFVREGCKILDGQTEISYKPEEINYLIIIPDNLHSYYLISDAIKNILTEVTIKPPEELTPRTKICRWFKFSGTDGEKHVLIDVPTTLRTLRFFREEAYNVDHWVHESSLKEAKKEVAFQKVRKRLKKDIELFSDSLDTIINKESQVKNNPR